MNAKLQFDFLVDKENARLTVRREFAAKRQKVWDCHTQSDYLNQWFAPKPFTTKTKSMDFSEGGHWHYAMIDPEGNEYWGYTEYVKIVPIDMYTTLDGFSNEAGEINPKLPRAEWEVTFADSGDHTMVQSIVQYESMEGLQQVIDMGMEEGLASTLERLDELLESLDS